jgi:hypothetical protein
MDTKKTLGQAAVALILQRQNLLSRKVTEDRAKAREAYPSSTASRRKAAGLEAYSGDARQAFRRVGYTLGVSQMLDEVRASLLEQEVEAAANVARPLGVCMLPKEDTNQAFDALKVATDCILTAVAKRLDAMYLQIQENLQTPLEPEGADEEPVRPGPGYELRKEQNDEILAAVYAALDKVRADVLQAKALVERL